MHSLPVVFNQHDFPELLGSSPVNTIASDGCLISSYGILANYYGKQTNPQQLNQFLKDNNLYVQEDLIGGDDTLQKVYPDIKYEKTYHYEQVPADLNLLHSLMDDPTISVILQIDEGNHSHFVVCVASNGKTTIADPWTGNEVDFATVYGDPATKILKFVVYSGTPATIEQQTTMYKGLNLSDTASMKVAVDTWDRVVNQHQFVDQAEYEAVKQEYNTVNETNRKLTEENASLNGKAAQLLQDMANYHNTDKTAVEQGLADKENLTQAEDALSKVAEHVDVQEIQPSYLHLADAIISNIQGLGKQVVQDSPTQHPDSSAIIQKAPAQFFLSRVVRDFVGLFWEQGQPAQ